ncbi:hypothetical protein L557_1614 [Bordetella pertussis STO1-CNMC-0004]|nr:hypothetical protein L564_0986 [Bordetella pertussis CHLA-15]ETI07273.1 hypothetical protein L557_1614 [Bordetella pertussis STO1-CNMC-0004]
MYAWFIRTGFEKLEIAGRAVPISRLNLDEYNLLTVHT